MLGKAHLAFITSNYPSHSSISLIQNFRTSDTRRERSILFSLYLLYGETILFFRVWYLTIFIVVPCVKIVKNLSLYYPIYILSTSCLHTIYTPIRNVSKRGRGSFSRNERIKEIENANSPTFPRFKKKRTIMKIVLYWKALLQCKVNITVLDDRIEKCGMWCYIMGKIS